MTDPQYHVANNPAEKIFDIAVYRSKKKIKKLGQVKNGEKIG